MSKEVVAEVIALIELGLIAPEDIVKCLRKANSEPEKALAEQPAQQEPVAYLCENAVGHQYFRWKKPSSEYKPIALYTSPQAQREWVGLTDEEVKECFESVPTQDCQNYEHWRSLCARNIETKLREKNT